MVSQAQRDRRNTKRSNGQFEKAWPCEICGKGTFDYSTPLDDKGNILHFVVCPKCTKKYYGAKKWRYIFAPTVKSEQDHYMKIEMANCKYAPYIVLAMSVADLKPIILPLMI